MNGRAAAETQRWAADRYGTMDKMKEVRHEASVSYGNICGLYVISRD